MASRDESQPCAGETRFVPEDVAVQGVHEEVRGSLSDLALVHLADLHDVLIVKLPLFSESFLSLAFYALADIVDSDHLVPKGGVLIF